MRTITLFLSYLVFSLSASAQTPAPKTTFTLEPDEQVIRVSDGHTEQQIKMIAKSYRQDWKLEKVKTQYDRLDCKVRRDIWPEEWWNYESLSNEKKARLLSDLAHYIPYTAALEMIQRGYFRNRPWSYDEFDNELYRADRYWYYVAVVQNGRDLAKRLGFEDRDCMWTRVTFVESVLLPQAKIRHPEGDVVQEFRLKIRGANFLDNESDRILLRFDGQGIQSRSESSIHSYSSIRRNSDEEYEIEALSRRTLLSDWTNAKYTFFPSGRGLILSFEDKYFDELSREEPSYKVILNVKLYRYRRWGSDRLEYSDSIEIRKSPYEIDFSKYLSSGSKYYVELNYQRRGSKYFDQRESRAEKSEMLEAR